MAMLRQQSFWNTAETPSLPLYLTEHGITAKSFPIMGEDEREVTFRSERKKVKGLVEDLLGKAIDDSWERGTFHWSAELICVDFQRVVCPECAGRFSAT
jgi:hypothetical protein